MAGVLRWADDASKKSYWVSKKFIVWSNSE